MWLILAAAPVQNERIFAADEDVPLQVKACGGLSPILKHR
jgi:hypothetical protein